jgi:glycine cleavage system H lipoate-binding protein
MAVIEKFLGQRIEIPDDCRFDVKQGLWGRCAGDTIVFGFTQATLVLSGGIKDMDPLVEANQTVQRGQSILFVITGKILYLETPVGGEVLFNKIVIKEPSRIVADPYAQGWLFSIKAEGGADPRYQSLAPLDTYLESLRHSEGFKNPEGLKGGVSGMCKAVYSGIGAQKIQ